VKTAQQMIGLPSDYTEDIDRELRDNMHQSAEAIGGPAQQFGRDCRAQGCRARKIAEHRCGSGEIAASHELQRFLRAMRIDHCLLELTIDDHSDYRRYVALLPERTTAIQNVLSASFDDDAACGLVQARKKRRLTKRIAHLTIHCSPSGTSDFAEQLSQSNKTVIKDSDASGSARRHRDQNNDIK
jgi:hypothetical protein